MIFKYNGEEYKLLLNHAMSSLFAMKEDSTMSATCLYAPEIFLKELLVYMRHHCNVEEEYQVLDFLQDQVMLDGVEEQEDALVYNSTYYRLLYTMKKRNQKEVTSYDICTYMLGAEKAMFIEDHDEWLAQYSEKEIEAIKEEMRNV